MYDTTLKEGIERRKHNRGVRRLLFGEPDIIGVVQRWAGQRMRKHMEKIAKIIYMKAYRKE